MAWPGSSDKQHAAWSRYRDYGKNRSYTWDDAGVFVFVCLGRVIAEGLLCFLPADTDGGLGFPSRAAFSALARASAFTASTAVCLARAVRATCCKSRVSVPLSEWHEATGTSSSELSGVIRFGETGTISFSSSTSGSAIGGSACQPIGSRPAWCQEWFQNVIHVVVYRAVVNPLGTSLLSVVTCSAGTRLPGLPTCKLSVHTRSSV